MKREEAEKIWRQKFEAFGLNECFEFLYRDWNAHKGRKCGIRCRKCGAKFETWGFAECIRGRQAHILCPNCGASSDGDDKWTRSPQCDAAMEYYVQGHTVKETAERFNVTTVQINNIVKRRGLTNGRDWQTGSFEANQKRAREAENRISMRLNANNFDYLGGYETGHIAIKCRICGDVFERTLDSLKKGAVPVCFECQKNETKKRQTEAKQQRIFESEQRQKTRKEKKQRVEVEKAEAYSRLLNDKNHVCIECGKYFSIADYMEDCGLKQIQHNPNYCSDVCKRKANHRKSKECKKRAGNLDRGNHRHRARKYGVSYESGITLKRLVQRDGLKCQICGGMCDWKDCSWTKYSGPTHPSIDHIIPMAKGGGHTWDNVQVAHMICNSQKCDKVEAIS